MSKKLKDLGIFLIIYVIAFAAGVLAVGLIFGFDSFGAGGEKEILRFFIFDAAATLVAFIFSVIFKNSSVYDPYWSVYPMVASIYLFAVHKAFSVWQIILLFVFNLWGFRLTANWVSVTTGFDYEDWRYRKFRDENPPFLWFIINLFGIHYVPTLVVFGGTLPLFEAVKGIGPLSVFGDVIILIGIALEFFADREMHSFLGSVKEKKVCRNGLWGLSRHPNYLGEMTVWVGVFIAVLPYSSEKWYYCVGALSIILLFNVVSIPLMEKRQSARRTDYAEYKAEVSRLFILPSKK